MTTPALVQQLDRQLKQLSIDMLQVKGALFGMIKDPEGVYSPSFIAEIRNRIQEDAPYQFTTPERFLEQVRGDSK